MPRRGDGFPILPVLVGGVLALVFVALVVIAVVNGAGKSDKAPVAATIKGVECNSSEQLAVHYHAHLDILLNGQPINITPGTGIDQANNCLYWLHVHKDDGIIHVEAPARAKDRVFTLGDFFAVWKQPLTAKRVTTITLQGDQSVKAFVDGKPFTGDPATIPLKSKSKIVIEITPPTVDPPPDYTWDDATYPS